MGIIVEKLASFTLSDGTEYTIELNASGTIHIHIDNVRIVLTKNEYKQLAQISSEGLRELKSYKKRNI